MMPKLMNWVMTQSSLFHKKELLPERVRMLEKLEFQWSLKNNWDTRFSDHELGAPTQLVPQEGIASRVCKNVKEPRVPVESGW